MASNQMLCKRFSRDGKNLVSHKMQANPGRGRSVKVESTVTAVSLLHDFEHELVHKFMTGPGGGDVLFGQNAVPVLPAGGEARLVVGEACELLPTSL